MAQAPEAEPAREGETVAAESQTSMRAETLPPAGTTLHGIVCSTATAFHPIAPHCLATAGLRRPVSRVPPGSLAAAASKTIKKQGMQHADAGRISEIDL